MLKEEMQEAAMGVLSMSMGGIIKRKFSVNRSSMLRIDGQLEHVARSFVHLLE